MARTIVGTDRFNQRPIQFEEDGTPLGTQGTVDNIDFTGAGVTATRLGNTLTVDIPGGGVGTKTFSAGITCDGSGVALTVGTKGYLTIPFTGTITGWYIVGDQVGSIVMDVWKAAGTLPTNANTITGTEKPTLTAQTNNSDTALSTWTTAVTVGDIMGFEIESISTLTKVNLVIAITQ